MRHILIFFVLALISSNLYSQKIEKIKFKSDRGNIIYYTAYANSDMISYCDLYFLPAGTNKANKVQIVTKRIEEDDSLGDVSTYCVPTKINIGGKIYRCEVSITFEYFNLIDENGVKTRFRPMR